MANTGNANLVLPGFTVAAGGHPHFSGTLGFTVAAVGNVELDKDLPTFTLDAKGGASGGGDLPVFTIDAYGESQLIGAKVNLPAFTIEAHGNNTADVKLPAFALDAQATNPIIGHLDADLPAFTLDAHSIPNWGGMADVRLPLFGLSASGNNAGRVVLPAFTLSADGTSNNLGTLNAKLPAFILAASGATANPGNADLVLPAFRLIPDSTADLVLPAFTLSAGGSVIVPVTRTALVLNPVNGAVTEYDHWDFVRVVRFNGRYYGFNESGIHLIGGNTADGTAINQVVETHPLRFGSSELKRPVRAYVAGRFNGDVKLTLTADEETSTTYRMGNSAKNKVTELRIKLSRNRRQRGRYWSVRLESVDGSALDVDDLQIVTQLLERNHR